MWVCQVCRFEVEMDDVALERRRPLCICVACYHRLAQSPLDMPKYLRSDVQRALDGDNTGPKGLTFVDAMHLGPDGQEYSAA